MSLHTCVTLVKLLAPHAHFALVVKQKKNKKKMTILLDFYAQCAMMSMKGEGRETSRPSQGGCQKKCDNMGVLSV